VKPEAPAEEKPEKPEKEKPEKPKKEKKEKEKNEKEPFRDGSARLFAYNKLKEGMNEEELLKLIIKDFNMKESNARSKIRVAKAAIS
jgi:hypothetical protein